MAVNGLRRIGRALAGRAPVPVYAAVGMDGQAAADDLSILPNIRLTSSPRHAGILLVAGRIPDTLNEALYRLHDQLPHPRASLWWKTEPPRRLADSARVESAADIAGQLPALYRRLWDGRCRSESDLLENKPPAPWRGRGDHGQGGEGMMGGTPYGRPMAMTGDDLRDGLALDEHVVRIGPFLPVLPPGLMLEVTLQGDVIQHAKTLHPPFPPDTQVTALYRRARKAPVPMAALERTRAAHHLRQIGHYLRVCELPEIAGRFVVAARAVECRQSPDLDWLRRALSVSRATSAVPPGLGRLSPAMASVVAGAADRAAGAARDARGRYEAYRRLNFQAVTRPGGDVRARVWQWFEEAVQSLALAEKAGDAVFTGELDDFAGGEDRDGSLQTAEGNAFDALLAGLEWQEAITVIASFDAAALRNLLKEKSA